MLVQEMNNSSLNTVKTFLLNYYYLNYAHIRQVLRMLTPELKIQETDDTKLHMINCEECLKHLLRIEHQYIYLKPNTKFVQFTAENEYLIVNTIRNSCEKFTNKETQ